MGIPKDYKAPSVIHYLGSYLSLFFFLVDTGFQLHETHLVLTNQTLFDMKGERTFEFHKIISWAVSYGMGG